LSASRGWIATVCFIPFLLTSPPSSTTTISSKEENDDTSTTTTSSKRQLLITAIELAIYNFAATGLLNIGLLKVSSSARASFLLQSSVVVTPLLSVLVDGFKSVNANVWSGCVAALAGLILLSSSGGGDVASAAVGGNGGSGNILSSILSTITNTSFGEGDIFILCSAISWSIYLFRTSKVGTTYPEIQLQFYKTLVLALLYTAWFIFASFFSADTFINLWIGWKNVAAWLILAYSAIGPGTVADIIQQQGQKEVSASEANIILSLEPVFTAIFGIVLLGEVTSVRENVGGGLIFLAALLASRESSRSSSKE